MVLGSLIIDAAGSVVSTIFPVIKPVTDIVASTLKHVGAGTDHAVHIDTADTDDIHLNLTGSLGILEYYIRCQNPLFPGKFGVFTVNGSGHVECEQLACPHIISPSLDVMFSNSVELETNSFAIAENTAFRHSVGTIETNAVADTIVRRTSLGGVAALDVMAARLWIDSTDPSFINIIGDSQLYYIPKHIVGGVLVPRTNCTYRFGRNHEELADISGVADGLEFHDHDNNILIQTQLVNPTIRIKGVKDAGVNFFEIQNNADTVIFAINNTGGINSTQLTTIENDIEELAADKELFDEDSVYIGSLKLSYKRSEHKFMVKRLALGHIPESLQAASFTTANLPAGKTIDTMTVKLWRDAARTFLSDDTLHAKDVFPLSAGADWEYVSGMFNLNDSLETSITGLNLDVDNLEDDITALQGSKQDTLSYSTVEANHATNLVTSANIKNYVDANAGGSTANPFLIGENQTYSVPSDFSGVIFWTRDQYQQMGASQITLTLPANPTLNMSFDFQGLNGQGTGQVFIKVPSGASAIWNTYSWQYNSEFFGPYPSNSQDLLIQSLGYMRIGVNYTENSNGQGYWTAFPRTNLNKFRANTTAIATNTTAITTNATAIADAHFFKFFANDEAGYAPLNAQNTHYTIPDGHMHVQLVYGDGLEQVKANCSGVWINLPANPADGMIVKHCTLHFFNSTSSSDVICIDFSQTGNQPSGRRLVDDHVLYTRGTYETALVEGHSTSTSTGRKESVFFYIQSEDMWVHRLASY